MSLKHIQIHLMPYITYGLNCLQDMMCLGAEFPGYDQRYGVDGAHLKRAIDSYNYDHHHHFMLNWTNNDFYLSSPGGALVMALHYGDLATANRAIDKHLVNILRQSNEPNQAPEAFGECAVVSGALPQMCLLLGRESDIRTLMTKTGYTWRGAEAKCADLPEMCPFIRPKGADGDGFLIPHEAVEFAVRASYILVADREVAKQELLDQLPTADAIAEMACIVGENNQHAYWATIVSPLLNAALVCERYGLITALTYIAALFEKGGKFGGCELAAARIQAHCCRGRLLAARGTIHPAELAFEAAFEEAERAEYWLLAAASIRERMKHCGDEHDHHGHEHDSNGSLEERLASVLKKMTASPADEILALF